MKHLTNTKDLIGKHVRVYRNLTRGCWSVQHRGLVVAHATSVRLKNVRFVVNQSGYERFLRENRKNVHAFVTGELVEVDCPTPDIPGMMEVTYNPRVASLFHTVKKCFKGREWWFSPTEQLQHGWCSGKMVFVSNCGE